MTDCRNPATSKATSETSGMGGKGKRGTRSHLSGAFSDHAKKDRASDRDVAWLPGMCTVPSRAHQDLSSSVSLGENPAFAQRDHMSLPSFIIWSLFDWRHSAGTHNQVFRSTSDRVRLAPESSWW